MIFAKNGKDAVDEFKKQRVSLILMDMEMPVMDGYGAAKAVREFEEGKEAPIIAMTAHERGEEIKRCMDAGCNDYLGKPIRRNRLIKVICKYLVTGRLQETEQNRKEKI